jgi:hypothetical protein
MTIIWENSENDGSLNNFNGKICPKMSGFQSRHSGMKYISIWMGIECLREKCQYYGNKCEKIDDNKIY